MTAHWHIGFNNPGYLPDPDSCWVVNTAQDALVGKLGEFNDLADEEVEGAAEAAAWLEEALPHFNEDGEVVLTDLADPEVRAILTALNVGELSTTIDGEAHWIRRCVDNCADA